MAVGRIECTQFDRRTSQPSTEAELTRVRSRLANLLLVVISLVVGLLLAEIGLRAYFWSRGIGREDFQALLKRSQQASVEEISTTGVFGLVQPSPYAEIVYEVKPNLRGTFREQELRTNSHGMRSREVDRRKPKGIHRIVGVGDSHMFGWGVAQDETYLSLLERQLNEEAGGRFEVLNMGAPGYNTAMEVATLEHSGLAFDPDLVLVHFVGNDLDMPHLLQPPRTAAPRDWYLLDLLRTSIGSVAGDELKLLPHDIRHLPEEEQQRTKTEYRHMVGMKGYRRAIDRLAHLQAESGIPVVVMMLGEGNETRRKVRRIIEGAGLGFFNPMVHFASYLDANTPEGGPRPNFQSTFEIPRDGHPSVAGHRMYADALFDEITRRLGEGS